MLEFNVQQPHGHEQGSGEGSQSSDLVGPCREPAGVFENGSSRMEELVGLTAIRHASVTPCTERRITFLVRGNELYHRTLDQVAGLFRSRGYTSVVESFPPGTLEQEVDTDLKERVENGAFNDCILIMDRFVQRSWHISPASMGTFGIVRAPTLDATLADCVLPIVRRKFQLPASIEDEINEEARLARPGAYLDAYGQCFSAVFRAALSGHVDRIDVLGPHLIQHEPFVTVLWRNLVKVGLIGGNRAFSLFNGAEYPQELLDNIRARWGVDLKLPLPTVQEWLIKSGYPERRIRLVKDLSELSMKDYSSRSRQLIIMDRHLAQENSRTGASVLLEELQEHGMPQEEAKHLVTAVRSQIVVQLPLENALLDLVGATLLAEEEGIREKEIVDLLYESVAAQVLQVEKSDQEMKSKTRKI